jgi:hypothetical protein
MPVTFKVTFQATLALVVAGLCITGVMANGVKTTPDPKTSTGRELAGPGTHHEEYIVPPADTPRVRIDTVRDERIHWDTVMLDSLQRKAIPTDRTKPGTGAPIPGVDNKSSTRPGE